jgi:hypothetical protein
VEDPAFAAQWKEARTIGKEELEAEANRRAYHGTDRPIFHAGEVVGHMKEYSDRLLMFLLRAEDPDKFKDNSKMELVGKGGAALPGVAIYLPDNGRSKADDASDDGPEAGDTDAAAGPASTE